MKDELQSIYESIYRTEETDSEHGKGELYISFSPKEEGGKVEFFKDKDGRKFRADYSFAKEYYVQDGETKEIDIEIDKITEFNGEEEKEVTPENEPNYNSLYKALRYFIDEEIHWGGHNEEGEW
jgi:hypothetical protein